MNHVRASPIALLQGTTGRFPVSSLGHAGSALIPGISRNGATVGGGLLRGIDHEDAARFSVLIATPIILGATALEVPKLVHGTVPAGTAGIATTAAIVAGPTASLSTAALMRCFHHHHDWVKNACRTGVDLSIP